MNRYYTGASGLAESSHYAIYIIYIYIIHVINIYIIYPAANTQEFLLKSHYSGGIPQEYVLRSYYSVLRSL